MVHRFLLFILLPFLFFATIRSDCTLYNDGTSSCCVDALQGTQACILVSSEIDFVTLQLIYGDSLMNEITFLLRYPPMEESSCVADSDLGWCVLLSDFVVNDTNATGTLTSTFSDQQAGTILTKLQGEFKVPIETIFYPRINLRVGMNAADPCSTSCPTEGGCKCVQNNGCNCCSSPKSDVPVCVQVTGVGEIQFMRSALYLEGHAWLNSVSRGSDPQAVCATNQRSNETGISYACLMYNDLGFTTKIYGSAQVLVISPTKKETIFAGDFQIV